ncbi:hypothetical protein KC19_11G043500 [Ceratodon purpureus]|uniref:Uncharacterized protein n=1 Tax=Ceratodon purpureus TaxID=3225 RepID=A0A8T0GCT3_CERPU|nr:hypothetical protein KC19_11G043500 [Ceratodon purpureus]
MTPTIHSPRSTTRLQHCPSNADLSYHCNAPVSHYIAPHLQTTALPSPMLQPPPPIVHRHPRHRRHLVPHHLHQTNTKAPTPPTIPPQPPPSPHSSHLPIPSLPIPQKPLPHKNTQSSTQT